MALGKQIGKLFRYPRVALASTIVALCASVASVAHIGLFPPHVTPRAVATSVARTSLIIDTPTSILLDLRQDTYSLGGLQNRALVLGNVIASPPVRDYIARDLKIPASVIGVTTPGTPTQPLPSVDPQHPRKTTDILQVASEYRLSIEADATVPVLDLYAEAPTVAQADQLANDAVDGLQAYMRSVGASQKVPSTDQVRLTQLGRAEGGTTNPGVKWQLMFLVFLFAYAIAYGALMLLIRFRRGFVLGAAARRSASSA